MFDEKELYHVRGTNHSTKVQAYLYPRFCLTSSVTVWLCGVNSNRKGPLTYKKVINIFFICDLVMQTLFTLGNSVVWYRKISLFLSFFDNTTFHLILHLICFPWRPQMVLRFCSTCLGVVLHECLLTSCAFTLYTSAIWFLNMAYSLFWHPFFHKMDNSRYLSLCSFCPYFSFLIKWQPFTKHGTHAIPIEAQ